MSFDVNPLNNATPSLKTATAKDGHAGSLGYFQQGNKNDEKNKSIFKEEKEVFSLKDAKNSSYAEPPLLLRIIDAITDFFKKLFNL